MTMPEIETNAAEYPPKIDADRVVIYKTLGEVELRLWIFEPADHKAMDKTPAIVFFSGGGWKNSAPTQFESHARYLASRGMVAMVADYRVESRHKTTPIECVKDACSAVRYIRAHAGELGIDPNRIAAGGGSAGGHIAAATATISEFQEEAEDKSVSCQPNALALFNPVIDNSPQGYGHERVKDYATRISPLENIRAGIPPSVLFVGTNDKILSVDSVKRWQSEIQKVGSRADLHIYEGAAHGFFNKGKPGGYYIDTLKKTDEFFISLGWLTGKPTLDEKSDE